MNPTTCAKVEFAGTSTWGFKLWDKALRRNHNGFIIGTRSPGHRVFSRAPTIVAIFKDSLFSRFYDNRLRNIYMYLCVCVCVLASLYEESLSNNMTMGHSCRELRLHDYNASYITFIKIVLTIATFKVTQTRDPIMASS